MLNIRNRANGDNMRSEVRDIYDYDLNIRKKAFDMAKDWVKTYQDNVMPIQNDDKKVLDDVTQESDRIKDILNYKVEVIKNIINYTISTDHHDSILGDIIKNRKDLENYYNEIIKNTDFLKIYNSMVNSFMSGSLSQRSKDSIKNQLQKISPQIDTVVFGLKNVILNHLLKFRTNHGYPQMTIDEPVIGEPYEIVSSSAGAGIGATHYFEDGFDINDKFEYQYSLRLAKLKLSSVITSYAIYVFVQKSLFRNSYVPVTTGDIQNEIEIFYSTLSDVERQFVEYIMTQDIYTESKNKTDKKSLENKVIKEDLQQAYESRIKDLEIELGRPLSFQEIAQVQKFYFNSYFKLPNLSVEEQEFLDNTAESIERSRQVRNTQMERNIALDRQPNYIAPEYAVEEGNVFQPANITLSEPVPVNMDVTAEIPPPEFSESGSKTEEIIQQNVTLFNTKREEFINRVGPLLNRIHPDVVTGSLVGQIKPQAARNTVRFIKNTVIRNMVVIKQLIENKKLTPDEIGLEKRNIDTDYPAISETNIESVSFRNFGVNDILKRNNREAIFTACDFLCGNVIDSYDYVIDNMDTIIMSNRTKIGSGLSRNVKNKIPYIDERNDPYYVK
jgi:hypothetical protein